MANSERRPHAGHITDKNFINALTRRYALIRGRYETIERECEDAVGVAALIDAQDRVESEKILMKRVLDAIEVVARDIDPSWSSGRINPIYPKKRDRLSGTIARTALNVLRKQRRPMTVRELSRASLAAQGHEKPCEREVMRFDIAIRASLNKRVGATIGVVQGPPKRYFIEAPAS